MGRATPASLLIPLAYLALLAAAAAAEDLPTTGDEVEVRIDTVLASNIDTTFDPALASLRQPFGRMFHYTSYRLVQGEQRRVNWRREAEFLLPGGRLLVVMPRSYKDDRILLNVMLLAGTRPLVDTTLALKNHGVFLVAGPRYEGGILIIAIGAGTTTVQASARTP